MLIVDESAATGKRCAENAAAARLRARGTFLFFGVNLPSYAGMGKGESTRQYFRRSARSARGGGRRECGEKDGLPGKGAPNQQTREWT